MAVRIPWDKYEASILLDACLKVERKELRHKEAITYVSQTLRLRAEKKGLAIDSIFRNENGINMQFSAMSHCLHHKTGGLTISKVFYQTVQLYETDKSAFYKLVKEAKDETSDHSKKVSFVSWLNSKAEYTSSSNNIFNSLTLLSVLATKAGWITTPIIKTKSQDEVSQLLDTLLDSKNKLLHSTKQKKDCVHALKVYLEYLSDIEIKDLENPKEADSVTREAQSGVSEDLFVDFSNINNLKFTRPAYFQFAGEDKVGVKNWTKLYVAIINKLNKLNPEYLHELTGENITGGNRADFLSKKDVSLMTAPYLLENDMIVETNLSATDIVKKIRALLRLYGVPLNSLHIAYHIKGERDNLDKNTTINNKAVISADESLYTQQVKKILEEYFAYGFRIGSPIEILRFRNFAENKEVLLPESDSELEKEIIKDGIQFEGRVYSFNQNVLSDLGKLASNIFESGTTVIFFQPFMEKNEEWMEEHFITSPAMVKRLLSIQCPYYYFGQNIVTSGERKTETEAIVYEIHRVSNEESVIKYSDLCKQLPYIPPDKVSWSLSFSDDFVRISEGKYFVMDKFIVSNENAFSIRDFVENECNIRGYASINELPLGEIPEQNYELSSAALYDAIYISLLKKDYYLKGKILTREKNETDIISLLKGYIDGRKSCSLSEVMDKCIELTGTNNRQDCFAVLYDSMIRTAKNEFVSEDQIQFNIEKIDSAIQEFIGSGFASIKEITTFAIFPPCGKPWNYYLLESYCYRFSDKYRLCLIHFNDKNAGIISSKSLNLSYNEMLSEAVSHAEISLQPEIVGKYLFDNGWMSKKKFKALPDIVSRAMQLREER